MAKLDRGGRRKVPRQNAYLITPKANVRAAYKLGLSLIQQLEGIAKTLGQQ